MLNRQVLGVPQGPPHSGPTQAGGLREVRLIQSFRRQRVAGRRQARRTRSSGVKVRGGRPRQPSHVAGHRPGQRHPARLRERDRVSGRLAQCFGFRNGSSVVRAWSRWGGPHRRLVHDSQAAGEGGLDVGPQRAALLPFLVRPLVRNFRFFVHPRTTSEALLALSADREQTPGSACRLRVPCQQLGLDAVRSALGLLRKRFAHLTRGVVEDPALVAGGRTGCSRTQANGLPSFCAVECPDRKSGGV